MSLIDVKHLTFTYDGSYDPIFEDVSFQIDTDWRLGFTGRNGRGKTTFFKLMTNCYRYSGSIAANVDFAYFPYAVDNPSLDTVQIVSPLLPDGQDWKLYRELNLLQLDPEVLYRPFQTLSNGEQTKVLLAALFLRDNGYLLIDEPTNHLDLQARKLVGDYLSHKSGFLLVSHDRAFLDRCVDHMLCINKTGMEVQKGNFSSWWQNKQLQDQFDRDEDERLQKDIQRLNTAANRAASWSSKAESTKHDKIAGLRPDRGFAGHKAAKVMQRAKSIAERRQEAVAQKSTLLKNVEYASDLAIHPLLYKKPELLRFEDICIQYGETPVCSPVSFSIKRGERIALTGKNGAGKSSLLKLIMQEDIPHTGKLVLGSGLAVSYVAQDTAHLTGSLYNYIRSFDADESLFFTILRKMDFRRVQFEKNMEDFSGGQKKKVLIARSLCERAHLYVWDEPLNYIDVYSRMQIEELLQVSNATLLFVEHDSAFCERIATSTVSLV